MKSDDARSALPATADELIAFLQQQVRPQLDEALRLASIAYQSFNGVPGVKRGFLDTDAAEDATCSIVNRLHDAIDEVRRAAQARHRR